MFHLKTPPGGHAAPHPQPCGDPQQQSPPGPESPRPPDAPPRQGTPTQQAQHHPLQAGAGQDWWAAQANPPNPPATSPRPTAESPGAQRQQQQQHGRHAAQPVRAAGQSQAPQQGQAARPVVASEQEVVIPEHVTVQQLAVLLGGPRRLCSPIQDLEGLPH